MPYPDSFFYPTPPNIGPDYYIFPSEFTAGDYFQFFYANSTLYPSAAGWSFQLALQSASQNVITLNSAVPVVGNFQITEIPANTAIWQPGRYVAQLYALNPTLVPPQRITIFQTYLNVLANVATSTAQQDLRSFAQIMVDTYQAVMQGKATDDILDSTIGDTTFRRLTPKQLREEWSSWVVKVRSENARNRANQGLATGRTIQARFSTPL